MTDANGGETRYEYDAKHRMTAWYDAEGTETKYEYDKVGNLAFVTANGKTAGFEYDLNGNILAVNSADGRSASFEYDALGNITAITYPDGSRDTYAYDALGQLISEQAHDGTSTEYTYDALGNVTAVTENGETTEYAYDELSQPVSVTYPDGSTEYSEYDSLGNIVKQTDTNGDVTTYGYTVENMVSRVTYADGSSLHYAYNKAGNLVRETDADGGITRYTYDLLGQVTNILSADGTTTEYEYNEKGEVVSELVRNIAYSGEDDGDNHYSNLANTSSKPLVATAIRYAYDTKSASSWPPKTTPKPQPKKPAVSTPKTQAKNASQSGRQTTIPTLSEFKELQQSGYLGGYGQYSNNKQSALFRNPVDYIYNYNKPAYQTYGPVRVAEKQSAITYYREPSAVAEATPKVESIDARLERGCNAPGANTNALGAGGRNYPASKDGKIEMLFLSSLEIAIGGIFIATGVGSIAGGTILAAGASSLFGGVINEKSGGTFAGGWLGGEVSGAFTGLGIAYGAKALGGIVDTTLVSGKSIIKTIGIAAGYGFAGGTAGGFSGSAVTQLLDNGEINVQKALKSGIINGTIEGLTTPLTMITYAVGGASLGISTTISIINETIFDIFSSELQNGR